MTMTPKEQELVEVHFSGSLRLSSEQIAESYSLAQAVQNEIGICGVTVIEASVQPLARNDPRIEPT